MADLVLHYFPGPISPSDCVLELGAGYGHFVNNVTARRRIALDAWEGFVNYLQPGIESRVGGASVPLTCRFWRPYRSILRSPATSLNTSRKKSSLPSCANLAGYWLRTER